MNCPSCAAPNADTAKFCTECGAALAAATRLERAECLAARGEAEEAETLLPAAREVFVELKARPWIVRADAAAAMGSDPASAAVTPA